MEEGRGDKGGRSANWMSITTDNADTPKAGLQLLFVFSSPCKCKEDLRWPDRRRLLQSTVDYSQRNRHGMKHDARDIRKRDSNGNGRRYSISAGWTLRRERCWRDLTTLFDLVLQVRSCTASCPSTGWDIMLLLRGML